MSSEASLTWRVTPRAWRTLSTSTSITTVATFPSAVGIVPAFIGTMTVDEVIAIDYRTEVTATETIYRQFVTDAINEEDVTLNLVLQAPATSRSSSTVQSATSSTHTVTTVATSSATGIASNHRPRHVPLGTALAIAIVPALALLASLYWFNWFRHRRRASRCNATSCQELEKANSPVMTTLQEYPEADKPSRQIAELPQPLAELPEATPELPDTSVGSFKQKAGATGKMK